MEAVPQRVVMLVLEDGKCPIQEWLRNVRDITMRARITRQIDKLGRGNFGVWRAVGESVAELKLDFGPGYRVYYARMGNVTVVLLGGGDKSSQRQDIKDAQDLWRRFQAEGASEETLIAWAQREEAQPIAGVVEPPNPQDEQEKKAK